MALIFVIWLFVIAIFSQFTITRNLLYKYSRVFSLGLASDINNNEYVTHNLHFTITYDAVGWENILWNPISDPNEETPFDQHIKVELEGCNPFYGVGAITALLAAITVNRDTCNLPKKYVQLS